jgi:hypothetical protein
MLSTKQPSLHGIGSSYGRKIVCKIGLIFESEKNSQNENSFNLKNKICARANALSSFYMCKSCGRVISKLYFSLLPSSG